MYTCGLQMSTVPEKARGHWAPWRRSCGPPDKDAGKQMQVSYEKHASLTTEHLFSPSHYSYGRFVIFFLIDLPTFW